MSSVRETGSRWSRSGCRFTWRPPPYEYEHTLLPIDILAGNATYREDIGRGTDPRRMAESWKPAVAEFERLRHEYRLY